MRRIISVLAFLVTWSSTLAFAQVKTWVDENGVVHYEATGPVQPPKTTTPPPQKPSVRRPLERSHAGLTLGENEAAFVTAGKGEYAGRIGDEGNYYRYARILPEGAVKIGILFVGSRLVFIAVEYRDYALGGWESLVKQTTEKHGPPARDTETVVWKEGKTVLRFRHELSGNITVMLEDLPGVSSFSEQQKAEVPRF